MQMQTQIRVSFLSAQTFEVWLEEGGQTGKCN